jgi:aminoglycoside phosphotransferase family enzyme/predicted kinase
MMDRRQRFDTICTAMENPAIYPHLVRSVQRRDTHISSVFLTGDWVYKLKKPVDLGFLDFRRLDARRVFCERELQLNKRLSQGVYVEVVKVFETKRGRYSLQGNGKVVEYAVKMRQLPEETRLKDRLARKAIREEDIYELGKFLTTFYKSSKRSPQIDHYGHPDVIAHNMEENFIQLEDFVGDVLSRENWEFLCHVSRSFLQHHQSLFYHRIQTGRICDGHGDLRAEHIYFYHNVQIIDCIEFNDRFRYGDVAIDLAFLYMDLEHLGYAEWGRALLAAYADQADDGEIYALIDFYATYRALVRLKVNALHCREVPQAEQQALRAEAKLYVNQAHKYAIQFGRPTLWAFCGLPATGKSSLANALSKTLSIILFQSDVIRKESQAGVHNHIVPFGQGLYRAGMRQRVYGKLLLFAQDTLKKGHSVILDATFSYRKWRDEVRRLCSDLDTNLVFVECHCKEKTVRSRLKIREKTAGHSDARLQHFTQIAKEFEPILEFPHEFHMKVNTEQPLRHSLAEVLSMGYTLKCQQVQQVISH